MVKTSDYDIKKLIMMQNLEPRTVGLNPTKIGHVDRVNKVLLNGYVRYRCHPLNKNASFRPKGLKVIED